MNLESKKRWDQSKQIKPTQVWVKKTWVKHNDLKCLVIHTALRAGNTSRW